MANNLKVGYARVNINPPLGVNIAGYFKERIADGILDDLEVCAVAVQSGESAVILMTVDNCGVGKQFLDDWRARIAERLNISADAVLIHSTHTHQGPSLYVNVTNPLNIEYGAFVGHRVVDAAQMAFEDLKCAKMGIGVGEAKNVAFIRRYRMKDGTAKTNPGVNNPDILHSIGDTDERVNVIRFDREGAETVVIGGNVRNFAVISAVIRRITVAVLSADILIRIFVGILVVRFFTAEQNTERKHQYYEQGCKKSNFLHILHSFAKYILLPLLYHYL